MAFDWSQLGSPLQGIGSGLMAAGAGGWQQFAPAYARGALLGQQQLQYKDEKKIRDLQAQEMQAQLDQQRTANQQAEAKKQAWAQYLNPGMMGNGINNGRPGGMAPPVGPGMMSGQFTPEQMAFLRNVSPDTGEAIIGNQLFKDQPQDKWSIQTIREGNQDVTYRINPQTGEREKLGAGSAFAPPQRQNNGGPEFGLAPVYTKDDQGKLHAFQLSKGGGWQEIPVPSGQQFAPALSMQDLGTTVQPVNTRTGAPEGPGIGKDVAGAAVAKTVGEGQGTAQVNLPNVEANASIIKNVLDKIKTSPGREKATGLSSLNPLNMIPGSDVSNFNALKEQLGGQVFLQAFNGLKGGGQITEVEGAKATNALIRLQTAQSDKEFLSALDDFGKEVDLLTDVARRKAQGNFSSQGDDPLGIR